MARPTKASLEDPAVVERLCAEIIEGRGIRAICAADDMPAHGTVYLRMANDPEFRAVIARARTEQQEAEIDRTVEMADAATEADHQVVKLRIWARQWRAAKLAPKKYGEKLDLEVKDTTPRESLEELRERIALARKAHDRAD